MGIVGKGVSVVNRSKRALAYRELAILQRDVGVHIVVGKLGYVFLLHGNIGGSAGGASDNHGSSDTRQLVTVRIVLAMQYGTLQQELYAVVTVEHIVIGSSCKDIESISSVLAFEIYGTVAYRIVDACGCRLDIIAGIARLTVTHYIAGDYIIVVDSDVGAHPCHPDDILERHVAAKFVVAVLLSKEQGCGLHLAPAVVKCEIKRGTARIVRLVGCILQRQVAVGVTGHTLNPSGALPTGIYHFGDYIGVEVEICLHPLLSVARAASVEHQRP